MPVRKKPQDTNDESRLFVWLEEPAVYVDTFSAKIFDSEGILRLVLGESLGNDFFPLWRTAVAMPVSDARRLSDRLITMLERHDRYLEKIAKDERDLENKNNPR